MGKNHARILRDLGYLDKIVEPNTNSRRELQTMGYGKFLRKSISDTDSDAYIVSTPSSTHFEIVDDLLSKGKHVLVEKPAFIERDDYLKARKRISEKIILAVGHVERFNPAVRELYRKNHDKVINRLEAYRYSSRPAQINDVGVWMDLGVHDVDIMISLMGIPSKVTAYANFELGIDVSFHANFEFPNGKSASINSSWLSITKRREILVFSEDSEIKCDLLTQSLEDIKIQKREVSKDNHFAPNVQEEKSITVLSRQEPLKEEIKNFIDCIENKNNPVVDIITAQRVDAVIQAAYESAKNERCIAIEVLGLDSEND